MKVLIVEDELDLLESIKSYLENEDLRCETASDFLTARDKISGFVYDIVVLDLGLPDGDGLDILKFIKMDSAETCVLIISARNSLDDKLKGLDIGADDYITKPFHLAELNSRINAIIRRKKYDGSQFVVFNEIEIDVVAKDVRIGDLAVELTRKEYDLLLYFIVNKNRVLSKQSIAEHLWGDYMEMSFNFDFLYTHIRNLRKKIKDKSGKDYIKTVYGLGYKYTDR